MTDRLAERAKEWLENDGIRHLSDAHDTYGYLDRKGARLAVLLREIDLEARIGTLKLLLSEYEPRKEFATEKEVLYAIELGEQQLTALRKARG